MSHILMVPCISAELASTLTTVAGNFSECKNRKLRSIPKKQQIQIACYMLHPQMYI